MSRYIDADKLYKSVKENVGAYWSEGEAVKEECLIEIDNAPTADVVEVVRCKDCKHYCLNDFRKLNEPRWCALFDGGYYYPKPTDYCSCGERREE